MTPGVSLWIGIDSQKPFDSYIETGFLLCFSSCRALDSFAKFNDSTWKCPVVLVGVKSPFYQD